MTSQCCISVDVCRERAFALNGLRSEAAKRYNQFNAGNRVRYSSAGIDGIKAGVYTSGTVVGMYLSDDETTCIATVLFDGKTCPEDIDARLLWMED